MNKKTVLIVGGGILALCVCAVLAIAAIASIGLVGGIGLTQPVADVGEKFMQSLKAADYNTAFGLCHPSLQQKLGNVQGLQRIVESGKAQPVKWSFNSRNIENGQGHMEGDVTMLGGEGTVTLDFAQSGSDWKVIGFNLTPK